MVRPCSNSCIPSTYTFPWHTVSSLTAGLIWKSSATLRFWNYLRPWPRNRISQATPLHESCTSVRFTLTLEIIESMKLKRIWIGYLRIICGLWLMHVILLASASKTLNELAYERLVRSPAYFVPFMWYFFLYLFFSSRVLRWTLYYRVFSCHSPVKELTWTQTRRIMGSLNIQFFGIFPVTLFALRKEGSMRNFAH